MDFLSQAIWNPVLDTWIQAIKVGFFATWPGILAEIVRKHYSKTIDLAKEHMRADRKNVRSTNISNDRKITTTLQEKSSKQPVRENEYYVKTIDLTGKIYSN